MTDGNDQRRRTGFGGEPHPWLQPLGRRVAIFALCLGWLAFELYQGDRLWIVMVAAASAYALWDFFLRGAYANRTPPRRGVRPPARKGAAGRRRHGRR
jgi:hypothetical protein